MLRNQRIDIVAPPFSGHLFPQLDLATRLRKATDLNIHLISTPSAEASVERCGLAMTTVLRDREHVIVDIANTPKRVGSNPFRLISQLRDNVSLMDDLISELAARWDTIRPDLVIADFAVPVAGLLAQRMGIPWWTAIRAPTVIDTPDGVPPYMGGLRPRTDLIGAARNRMGRFAVRSFKRLAHLMFRKSMRRLGIPSVYRADGYERIYSDEKILIQGVRELEFECEWPPSSVFIGPLTSGPTLDHESPTFVAGKPHVLVSLGTHVRWAKGQAAQTIRALAARMPDVEFHFTRGAMGPAEAVSQSNYHEFSYLPYDQHLHRYSASINHTGSGIMYSCLRHGVPILAWPQDFDQFDNTARVVFHGLGLRCRPNADNMEQNLRCLLTDHSIQRRCHQMRSTIAGYDVTATLLSLLKAQFSDSEPTA